MSASKKKGTTAESAVVNYLRTWFPHVERRALSGVNDKGDVAGIPGVVIEVKDCVTMTLGPWMKEAELEAHNAKASVWMVWHHRRGKGNPADWFVTMPGYVAAALIAEHQRTYV